MEWLSHTMNCHGELAAIGGIVAWLGVARLWLAARVRG